MSDLSKASTGSHLQALEAIRDAIIVDLEKTEAMRDRSALYLRLTDVLGQINELAPPVVAKDPIDEIANRRKKKTGRAAS